METTRLTSTLFVLMCASRIFGDEPVTLDNVEPPTPNRSDERLAAEFSLAHAVHFLDSASLNWQKQRKCFTCHTNYA